MSRITASVKFSQPIPPWEAGSPERTLKMVLRRNTHCLLQSVRSVFVRWTHTSDSSSLRILRRLGGSFVPSGTEKERPIAAPGVWYGSCPRITTRTLSSSKISNIRNMLCISGKHTHSAYSLERVCISSEKYGCCISSDRFDCQEVDNWIAISRLYGYCCEKPIKKTSKIGSFFKNYFGASCHSASNDVVWLSSISNPGSSLFSKVSTP